MTTLPSRPTRSPSIVRVWHGRTPIDRADDYLRYLQETGIPDYLKTPGNLRVEVWRKKEGTVCHFWTVTKWKDIESIKKFAGEEYEKARYYDQDKFFLLAFEPQVIHYESFEF